MWSVELLGYRQCRRQSNRSEEALADRGGALKHLSSLLHIKTDILRLQIVRYFNDIVSMSEKCDVLGRQRFLVRFVSGPYD